MNPDSTDAKSTEEVPIQAQRFVVGLGASAGGLDSLEKFFKKCHLTMASLLWWCRTFPQTTNP